MSNFRQAIKVLAIYGLLVACSTVAATRLSANDERMLPREGTMASLFDLPARTARRLSHFLYSHTHHTGRKLAQSTPNYFDLPFATFSGLNEDAAALSGVPSGMGDFGYYYYGYSSPPPDSGYVSPPPVQMPPSPYWEPHSPKLPNAPPPYDGGEGEAYPPEGEATPAPSPSPSPAVSSSPPPGTGVVRFIRLICQGVEYSSLQASETLNPFTNSIIDDICAFLHLPRSSTTLVGIVPGSVVVMVSTSFPPEVTASDADAAVNSFLGNATTALSNVLTSYNISSLSITVGDSSVMDPANKASPPPSPALLSYGNSATSATVNTLLLLLVAVACLLAL